MSDEMPVYLVGDTIRLRMELEHDFHLGAVGAFFYRRPEEESGVRLRFDLQALEIREIGRTGTTIKSLVTFEEVISDSKNLPGIYDLGELMAKPLGEDRKSLLLDDRESREEGLSFRVAREPDEKSSEVKGLELERPERSVYLR